MAEQHTEGGPDVAAPVARAAPAGAGPEPIVGIARVDRRTKDLAKRILPGEVAVIDHEDLDMVATESLLAAGVVAVVNASACISGRYPNPGPLLLPAAGVAVVDGVGADVMDDVVDGSPILVDGDRVVVRGETVAVGTRQDTASFRRVLDDARSSMGDELQRFAENTLSYIQSEGHLLVDDPDIPDVPVDFQGRQVLLVVRGVDYKKDLAAAAAQRLPEGAAAAADRRRRWRRRPPRDGPHARRDHRRHGLGQRGGPALRGRPGRPRLRRRAGARGRRCSTSSGLDHVVFASAGTSEDIAMLLAFERGADLIVAVGTHSSMVDFLDKGRRGMASTFLVRMKVGPILVDAKGVNRLYATRVRKRDLLPMVLAALVTMVIIVVVSEPLRTVGRGLLLSLR